MRNPAIVRALSAVLLTLTVLARPGVAAAASPTIARSASGAIELSGAPCPDLLKEAAALREWKRNAGESASAGSALPECRNGKLDVSGILPARVAGILGLRAPAEGPNCWNTALYVRGIASALRHSSSREFSHWMSSPLCRALGAREKPAPGDIIAIRELSGGSEFHGMIYVSERLAFHKESVAPDSAYEFVPLVETLAKKKVSRDRFNVEDPGDPESEPESESEEESPRYARVYRCQSLEEYAASSDRAELASWFKRHAPGVVDAEQCVSELSFSPHATPAAARALHSSLEAIMTGLQEEKKALRQGPPGAQGKETRSVLDGLTERVWSLFSQLDYLFPRK